MDSIEAHGGRSWHHPKLAKERADEIRLRLILGEGGTVSKDRLNEINLYSIRTGSELADDEMLYSHIIAISNQCPNSCGPQWLASLLPQRKIPSP